MSGGSRSSYTLPVSEEKDSFDTWRLESSVPLSACAVATLPGNVLSSVLSPGDTDYVHARNAALHNLLVSSGRGDLWAFCHSEDTISLCQVSGSGQVSPCAEWDAQRVTSAASRLHPSLVEIEGSESLLLVALGSGSATILDRAAMRGDGGPHRTVPVLSSSPSAGEADAEAAGVGATLQLAEGRAIQLVAAALEQPAASGEALSIRVVCWSAERVGNRTAAAIWLARLEASLGEDGSWSGRVLSLEILQKSPLPPHGCLLAPGRVLLALDPGDGRLERTPSSSSLNDAADEEDDLSPRTLAQARAALDKYTVDSEIEGLPEDGTTTDIFRETGAEDAPGNEPACSLFDLRETEDASVMQVHHITSFLPHRLLCCSKPSASELVLGLTDDVDGVAARVSLAAAGIEIAPGFSIPALSYVASGKRFCRALLLSQQPRPGACRAALVESKGLGFVYRPQAWAPSLGQPTARAGQAFQRLVDLGAAADEVVGAALAEAEKRLVVLSRSNVLWYNLEADA